MTGRARPHFAALVADASGKRCRVPSGFPRQVSRCP